MKRFNRFKNKINNYLFDHYTLSESLSIGKTVLLATIAAALYAIGFCCFVTPADANGLTIVTGGAGGISQNIWLIIRMCGNDSIDVHFIQSIFYFVINIPLIIFAFFAIGKKFAILTLVDVALSSAFVSLFNSIGFTKEICNSELIKNSAIARSLFAGLIIGLSSAIAFKAEISSGGIDIVSYYFSLRKSTSVGKYTVTINFVIVVLFSINSIIYKPSNWVDSLLGIFFSVVYLLTTMLVVDVINIRNKKVQIQIVTNRPDMSSILIANFPHSTTVVKGIGGYSGNERSVVYMTVSSNESNNVIKIARQADINSFISVTPLRQVYGKFYIKPIE